MSPDWSATLAGYQEAQQAMLRAYNAVKPSGAFGRAVKYATNALHRGASIRTHVDTGTLKSAHIEEYYEHGSTATGLLYLAPNLNPRSLELASIYGVWEHQRGGSHAFYQNTVDQDWPTIRQEALAILYGGIASGS